MSFKNTPRVIFFGVPDAHCVTWYNLLYSSTVHYLYMLSPPRAPGVAGGLILQADHLTG
jgi:hypothetical protein